MKRPKLNNSLVYYFQVEMEDFDPEAEEAARKAKEEEEKTRKEEEELMVRYGIVLFGVRSIFNRMSSY